MNKKIIFLLLLLSALIPACAADRVNEYPIQLTLATQPEIDLAESRAMYMYSLSRLRLIEGDNDGALTFIEAALEEDPDSAFLNTAEATVYLKMNRVMDALNSCETAIKLDPQFVGARVLAGNILSAMKQDQEAIEQYKKVLELDPSNEEVYLHLAVSQVRTFEYVEAVDTLKKLLKVIPDSALGYYYLGKTYDQMKLNVEAAKYYSKAIELKPDFEQAYIDLGISQESQGDYDNAIITYRRLLNENPLNVNVIEHLIQLYIHQQRFEEALGLLKGIAHSGIGGVETHKKIGLIYLEMEKYKEALKEFGDILKNDPEAHQVRFYLASTYEEMKDYDHAIAEFGKIPSTDVTYYDALGHMAFDYKDKGEPGKGIDLLKAAIAAQPDRIDPYLHLAGLYEAMERYGDGLKVLLDIEKRFPADAALQFRIGILYDKMGNKDASIEHMKKTLALAPDDAQALNYLGYTYAEMGTNLEEAEKYLTKAVSLKPDEGFIIDSLGWVYFKLKRYDDAVKQLEKAVSLLSDDTTVMGHLADAYAAKHEWNKALKIYRQILKQEPERKDIAEKIKKIKAETGEK
ncbi:MAG TPA: tetratricopeptide repeat protein [Geobacteraceae bacterium]|nr:tetratricopeptide repeat protein [Geobacteraceae bacterium]